MIHKDHISFLKCNSNTIKLYNDANTILNKNLICSIFSCPIFMTLVGIGLCLRSKGQTIQSSQSTYSLELVRTKAGCLFVVTFQGLITFWSFCCSSVSFLKFYSLTLTNPIKPMIVLEQNLRVKCKMVFYLRRVSLLLVLQLIFNNTLVF